MRFEMKKIKFKASEKPIRLQDLALCVASCNLCPRMTHRNKVLSEMNGNVDATILVVAEAPGRLGADKTGIPLYGDKTGDNFEKLIYSIGLSREEIFITNAVLCNPRTEEGNNDTPNKTEIYNCSVFLHMVINLIQPKFIITLGQTALRSLNFIEEHDITVREGVGKSYNWKTYALFPMYHPGPRALIHRPLLTQLNDYKNFINASRYKSNKSTSKDDILQQIILYFLKRLKDISFFKATKLLFLLDYLTFEESGYTLSGATYLRQVEGPWIPKLKDIVNKINDDLLELYYLKGKPYIKYKRDGNNDLLCNHIEYIDDFLNRYGSLSDKGIKIAAYRTKLMQYVLEQEKSNGSLLNKVILTKSTSIYPPSSNKSEMVLF